MKDEPPAKPTKKPKKWFGRRKPGKPKVDPAKLKAMRRAGWPV